MEISELSQEHAQWEAGGNQELSPFWWSQKAPPCRTRALALSNDIYPRQVARYWESGTEEETEAGHMARSQEITSLSVFTKKQPPSLWPDWEGQGGPKEPLVQSVLWSGERHRVVDVPRSVSQGLLTFTSWGLWGLDFMGRELDHPSSILKGSERQLRAPVPSARLQRWGGWRRSLLGRNHLLLSQEGSPDTALHQPGASLFLYCVLRGMAFESSTAGNSALKQKLLSWTQSWSLFLCARFAENGTLFFFFNRSLCWELTTEKEVFFIITVKHIHCKRYRKYARGELLKSYLVSLSPNCQHSLYLLLLHLFIYLFVSFNFF